MFANLKILIEKNKFKKNQNKKYYWFKFFALIIFANLILVLLYNKIILENKIYIPSYYFLSQTLYNWTNDNDNINKSINGFNIPSILFYISSLSLNIPLFIFSYFKLGKKYTIRSFFSILTWFFIGIIFSINKIDVWLTKLFDFKIIEDNIPIAKRVEKVSYYLIAIFAGFCIGIAGSIIWKQQTSGGGMDFIYTYFAAKKKKEIQKVSIIINFIIIILSISLNEVLINKNVKNIKTFVLLLITSLMFGYSYSWILSYLYPKFKLVNLMIITTKFDLIKKEILKNYKRGGNVIDIKGLFDSKDKKIILTTMTYLEKEDLIKKIQKLDNKCFFITHSVLSVKGNFKIKVYDNE